MLAVLPQVEEAVEEYLVLLELLCQGEKLQAKLKEEMAFLEGAENHSDHLIFTLEQRSFAFALLVYFKSSLETVFDFGRTVPQQHFCFICRKNQKMLITKFSDP